MVIQNLNKLYFVVKCVLINDKNQILILKRSDYQKNETQDLWDLPGGNVNLYEDVNASIKREVEEEIGVVLKETNVFGVDSCKHIKEEAQVIFVLFSSKNFYIKKGIILSEEHSEYKWISVNELNNFNFYLTKERINKIKDYLKAVE